MYACFDQSDHFSYIPQVLHAGTPRSNFWLNFKTREGVYGPALGHRNLNSTIFFVWIVYNFGLYFTCSWSSQIVCRIVLCKHKI